MMKILVPLVLLSLAGCSALDRIGDKIDADCVSNDGVLDATQGYLDSFNERLANKDREFRIDGITCLEE